MVNFWKQYYNTYNNIAFFAILNYMSTNFEWNEQKEKACEVFYWSEIIQNGKRKNLGAGDG